MNEKEPNIEMTGESLDVSVQRKQELKQLFPGVFTETKNEKGEVVETIDFEKLKAELGSFSDVYDGKRERYGMEWPGKRDCMKLIQQPSRATLKPCREESVDFDSTENLFIEGDNLEVLKLLQKSYYGKVKMIYIDPPYNTGKEFIYPDKYSESLETYMAYAGLVDDEGKKFATNTATEGRFHTKWLNMMYPRLYLARNLLREDGVVFISIDDSERENIQKLLDEIFGELNFVGSFIWQSKKGGGSDNTRVVTDHEYVLCFAKDIDHMILSRIEIAPEPLDREDDQGAYRRGRELNKWGANSRREDRPTMYFPISGPDGEDVYPIRNDGAEGCWRWGKKKMDEVVALGNVEFSKRDDGTYIVYEKVRTFEPRVKPHRTWLKDVGTTADGSKTVKELFDEVKVFDFPKPIELLEKIISIGASQNESIVLDFFSGSCSTAHAVINASRADSVKRNHIMIQLPELCDNESESYKAGYKTIADIGKERIRRAAQKIRDQQNSQLDLVGKGDLDLGFKVLKLDKSNFKQWQTPSTEINAEQLGEQLELHTDHVDPYATQEEILYELLLKAGFVPTSKVDTLELAGKSVFSIDEGALLICLEDELTAELIDAVAELEPMQFICLDKGFNGNDQLKANAVQTFKSRAQNAEAEMVFKVV
ncbi:MAG: DNA methyltransferase [Gammaproteobacteria bacterium]|jgi:adenine-specific DNA-methyltransferase|nr:DNA methyltransferase [Gammaproteobacteria bacterium]